jgi:hypothetical protein
MSKSQSKKEEIELSSENDPLKNRKNNPLGYVRIEDCRTQHTQVSKEIFALNMGVNKIVNTLLGEEEPGTLERKGGLVADIRGIRESMKSRLSGRDKASIAGSIVIAISAIIVALLK